MFRVLKFLTLILTLLFLLTLPALSIAQDDATPTAEEPTAVPTIVPTLLPDETPLPDEEPARDRSETVITIALIVVSVIAVVMGSQLVVLARSAFIGQSPLVQEFIRLNSTRLLSELDRRAVLTETKLDDEAVAEIRRLVNEIMAEQRAGVPPAN